MKSYFSLILMLLAVFTNVNADEATEHSNPSFLLGHNLTPTSYTLAKDQWIIGPYVVAYGITDQLLIGTSPWMIVGYNMPMVDLKYAFPSTAFFDRASVELMYFKTFEYGFNAYHQESTWIRLTSTHNIKKNYSLHASFGFQYFLNDLSSYSMRPPPLNNTPLTLSISALQEIHITQNWGVFIESGFLGFNYPNRYLHVGASVYYQWIDGYIQLGLSRTLPIGPEELTDHPPTDEEWRSKAWKYKGEEYSRSIYYDNNKPFHPEIQVQFFL